MGVGAVRVATLKMRVFCAFTSIIGLVPLATIGRPRGLMSVTSDTRLELLGSPTNRQESFIQHSKIDPDKSIVWSELRNETRA